MLQAFCATEQQLDLYIAPTNGSVNYQQIIASFCLPDSVQVQMCIRDRLYTAILWLSGSVTFKESLHYIIKK